MNALAKIEPALDEIITFMGPIPSDEYAACAKLRSYRNAATGMVALTHCDTARQLAWMAIEYASPCLYAPRPLEGWTRSICFAAVS